MNQSRLFIAAGFCVASLFAPVKVEAAIFGSPMLFASGTAIGSTVSGPDSITVGNGSVWVSYVPSGTSSSDFSGTSTVVQYSLAGAILHTYTFAGSVDGLKINPNTGDVWAMQNQDGNSRLSIINPSTTNVTVYNYAPPVSAGNGYDDVVFSGSQIFLSFTNPGAGTDPVLQTLNGLTTPLTVNTIATYSAHPSTLNDPDSLKMDNHGNLVLSSGDDGALNFFSTSGTFQRAISIRLGGAPVTGLDDSFFATAGSGTIYFADTATNSVYKVEATGLTADSIYASVGSAHAIGLVDSTTGAFTTVITDGATNSSPHGLAFVSTPEPATFALLASTLALVAFRRTRKELRR